MKKESITPKTPVFSPIRVGSPGTVHITVQIQRNSTNKPLRSYKRNTLYLNILLPSTSPSIFLWEGVFEYFLDKTNPILHGIEAWSCGHGEFYPL